jgi:undecaprenyl-diphosphatase
MSAATRAAWACGALALAFVLEGILVTTGATRTADRQVAMALQQASSPGLLGVFRVIAVLGGPELCFAVAIGLFVYLRRAGFRAESWALLALLAATVVEVIYKHYVVHPAPPLPHPDGWSLAALVQPHTRQVLGNSFPSGHVLRAVFAYGLLAFVINRLAPPGVVQRLAVPAAIVLIACVAFDRLYLEVHWQSDIVGGLLLGGLALAAAITWLEQPWRST